MRGKNGGMELAHEPGEIRLGALIRDMENDLALVECMGSDNHCILSGCCGLKPIVAGAMKAFMDHLDAHTLADVIPPFPPAAIRIAPERAAAARSRMPVSVRHACQEYDERPSLPVSRCV